MIIFICLFQKNATGQVIFDKVVQHLDLIETDYFGLTFRDKSGKKVSILHLFGIFTMFIV